MINRRKVNRIMQGTIFFLFSVGQIACSPEIVQMPIPFDEERITLSLEYLQERYGIEKESPKIDPVMVVVHWTAINSLQDSYHAFEGTRLPGFREAIRGASPLNVSAHFLIDREGTIYRLMPDTLFARHVIGLNHCAIGIENIGSDENPLTDKQMKSNLFLIRQLHRTYDIQYVIGHHEYTSFKGHPLWKEVDPDYITIKTDPGDEFMKRLRKKLSSLNIKGPPE